MTIVVRLPLAPAQSGGSSEDFHNNVPCRLGDAGRGMGGSADRLESKASGQVSLEVVFQEGEDTTPVTPRPLCPACRGRNRGSCLEIIRRTGDRPGQRA